MTETLKEPTAKAARACAHWLETCLELGWHKSDLDFLEALWWRHHDHTGKLSSALAGIARQSEQCVCCVDDGLVQEWVSKARAVAKSKGYEVTRQSGAEGTEQGAGSRPLTRLLEELKPYLRHMEDCAALPCQGHYDGTVCTSECQRGDGPCSCGLEAVLAK